LNDPKHAGNSAALAWLAQLAVMAAIVATIVYFPLGLVLIAVFRVAGVGYVALITFGGAFGMLLGLIAWWLLVFAAALVYAAFMFPWGEKTFGRPRKE
jgi:succinate-acetate transporter protein